MKKYLLLFTLASLVALQGCNQKTPAAAGDEAVPAADAAATPASDSDLATSDQRLSYGIAFGLGQRMAADGVPLDTGAFNAGLSDALAGSESRLTEEEIAAEMQAYQEKATAEMAVAQAEAGAANAAASAAFLEANGAKDGVVTTESGLQYELITEGTGPMPGPDDQVEVQERERPRGAPGGGARRLGLARRGAAQALRALRPQRRQQDRRGRVRRDREHAPAAARAVPG